MKETKEETLNRVKHSLPIDYSAVDICEAYRIARNKIEALSDEEIQEQYDMGEQYDFFDSGYATGYIKGIIKGRDLFIY